MGAFRWNDMPRIWRTQTYRYARWFASALSTLFLCGCASLPTEEVVLRIYDWKTERVYVEVPTRVNSRLLFAWVHSLEKIPWNEYYHVTENLDLVLETITFPAFGAGIPEDKGRVSYVKNGLIHMEEIDQIFAELVWLNSHMATRELVLDGIPITRGSELPEHTRLRLVIEKTKQGELNGGKKTGRQEHGR